MRTGAGGRRLRRQDRRGVEGLFAGTGQPPKVSIWILH